MENFILLDGLTLYVFLGLLFLTFFCSIVIAGSCIYQDKQLKRLQRENRALNSEIKMKNKQLAAVNAANGFLNFRAQELREEISLRDEAIADSLKGSASNV